MKIVRKFAEDEGAAKAARRIVREVGKSVYQELAARPGSEQLQIAIFPAFWRGGIDRLHANFFRNPDVVGTFSRVMLKALYQWHYSNPIHFQVFVHGRGLLRRIREQQFPVQAAVRETPEKVLLLNPHVFALTTLIYEGRYKMPNQTRPMTRKVGDQSGELGPIPVPADYWAEYDEFGAWIVSDVWEQIDYVRQKWEDMTPHLQ
jgi:hypothetical protein